MLKTVLVANATSCAVFGLMFLVKAPSVSAFLGSVPTWLLYPIGAGLLVNAVLLLLEAKQIIPDPRNVRGFAIGDGIWVLVSIALVATGTWITTQSGTIWTLGVASFVGACGFLQFSLTAKRSVD
ncbi:MAG: hypothetical protein AAF986_00240 [Pseudomonadota bacterium]